ncbi:MAG: sugar ABC transporter substrate-binding protein [Chloroflexota bacterium]|nr:sugar ABC transporter substrate-binding protein [Chloroflexota bacterium]
MIGPRHRREPLTSKEVDATVHKLSRRGFAGGFAGLTALAAAAGLGLRGVSPSQAAANALGIVPEDLPAKTLRAAFSEIGFACSWCVRGADTAKFFGDLLGVEVTVYDGQLSADKQRQDIEDIAGKEWDFVAIHPLAINQYVDPVTEMISKGIPVIDMDTKLADDLDSLGIVTFLEPDNIYMGETMAKALFDAIGGEGEVIHTQGALTHTGAQGRAQGFQNVLASYPGIQVVDEQPADWDINKTASIWQDLLSRFPDVKGGYFHNDDMALAAYSIIEGAGKTEQIKVVGIDGMQPAAEAVRDGKLVGSVINPTGRIHGGAMWAGYLSATQSDKHQGGIPKFIRTDGGPITKENAEGFIWLGDNLLI